MKVLQIIADGSPGGGTTAVLELSRHLMNAGLEVGILSQRQSHALQMAKAMGLKVIDGADFFRSRWDPGIVRRIREAVSNYRPDVTHVHGSRAGLAWIRATGQLQKRGRGASERGVYTVHGYQFWKKPTPIRQIAQAVERRISRFAFRTIHVSSSDRKFALSCGLLDSADRGVVIRNGIDLETLQQTFGQRDPNRRKHETLDRGCPVDRRNVGVLGRITRPKNPHLILDLASDLKEEGFCFHFIGGGDMENEIRDRASRESICNVRFHGSLSRQAALAKLAEQGAFILPSLWEGLPLAPVEAMAMGIPVVLSKVNGCPEIVDHGKNGLLVASGDREGFAAALRRLHADPRATERMIANARGKVREEFLVTRVLRDHLEIYKSCRKSP
ncbi:MAG: glycosyltransferase [Planctomycetota bacterium]